MLYIWIAKAYIIMKYEARKTHGRDKLYVRAGGGGVCCIRL